MNFVIFAENMDEMNMFQDRIIVYIKCDFVLDCRKMTLRVLSLSVLNSVH